MTANLTVTSDLDRVIGGFSRAAAVAPDLIAAGRRAAAESLIVGVSPIIVAHTPRISGKLAASTTADFVDGTDTAVVIFRQPATSAPNADGTGGGQHYVQWVVGGRGPIRAPSDGPFSTGKKALRTPWGFRKSVKAALPNPYPEEAMAEASVSIIPATLSASGRQIGASIVSAIRGSV